MIRALLIVRFQREKDEYGNARQETWGEFDFQQLPSSGDRLNVLFQDENHVLEVKFVQHFPVQHPIPETAFPSLQRKVPVQHIEADWIWSD